MMKANYDRAADVLCLRFSDTSASKDVSYGGNVSLGYSDDGQLAVITILDASRLLSENAEDDDPPLVLTDRESCQLAGWIDHPLPHTEAFLMARARHLERLRVSEPTAIADTFAWMQSQVNLLRNVPPNAAQVEALAEYFEVQVYHQMSDLRAIVRRILIDLRSFELDPNSSARVDQLVEFRARAADALRISPSLRSTVFSDLDSIWQEACMALKYHLPRDLVVELPEICPYTIEVIFGDVASVATAQNSREDGEVIGERTEIPSHITQADGNIFLDLGFAPEEAARLKADSDRHIVHIDRQAADEAHKRLTQEALADVDSGRAVGHSAVQSWSDSLRASGERSRQSSRYGESLPDKNDVDLSARLYAVVSGRMAVETMTYKQDLNAWAIGQARLLRAGCFDQLDVEHLADEIEAVGQRERRELANGVAVLLDQLIQWAYQPERRGAVLEKTITAQRKEIRYVLDESPSLVPHLDEPRWLDMVWAGAIAHAVNETGLAGFPENCPWMIQDEVLNVTWWPKNSVR